MRIKMVFLLAVIVSFISFGAKIFSGNGANWHNTATVGEMSHDEFFRRLSQRYYGTTEFAEELALVNRALEFMPLDEIKSTDLIIPDQSSISRLQARQTMNVADDERSPLALRQQHQSLNWSVMQVLLLFIGLNQMVLPLLAGVVALIFLVKLFRAFRNERHREKSAATTTTQFAKNSDRILVEFDVTQLNEKK
ncbi:hypothetical protein B6D60_01845 [candidate division KSB1 bacterium 4484_87]|nr:MAG: hypothetical protein B6D60_01845 [candidate division KSB1 bacterium 4484_87]